MEKTEQQQFLEELEVKPEDVLEKPLVEAETTETTEKTEDEEQKAKNRRERRLLAKLQAEREANIDLNARLQTVTEANTARKSTEEADYLKLVERIYGTDTPEKREATEILKKALEGVHHSAKQEALTEAVSKFQEERQNESQAIEKEEQNLDEIMENLEDDHNADFSDEATRKGFLNLLERASPKDDDGNIVEYADPETVWELYKSQKEKSSSRAKELASRSMERGGASAPSKIEEDSQQRLLKEMGIL